MPENFFHFIFHDCFCLLICDQQIGWEPKSKLKRHYPMHIRSIATGCHGFEVCCFLNKTRDSLPPSLSFAKIIDRLSFSNLHNQLQLSFISFVFSVIVEFLCKDLSFKILPSASRISFFQIFLFHIVGRSLSCQCCHAMSPIMFSFR